MNAVFASEVIVEIARTDIQFQGDLGGGDIALTPFIKQGTGGEQNFIGGFQTYCTRLTKAPSLAQLLD